MSWQDDRKAFDALIDARKFALKKNASNRARIIVIQKRGRRVAESLNPP
jgi:hypothetical protein